MSVPVQFSPAYCAGKSPAAKNMEALTMLDLRIDPQAFDDVIRRAVEATVRRMRDERPGSPERLLYDKIETAAMTNLSVSTIERLTYPRGDLRPVRLAGRTLFSREEIDRWISTRTASRQEGGPEA